MVPFVDLVYFLKMPLRGRNVEFWSTMNLRAVVLVLSLLKVFIKNSAINPFEFLLLTCIWENRSSTWPNSPTRPSRFLSVNITGATENYMSKILLHVVSNQSCNLSIVFGANEAYMWFVICSTILCEVGEKVFYKKNALVFWLLVAAQKLLRNLIFKSHTCLSELSGLQKWVLLKENQNIVCNHTKNRVYFNKLSYFLSNKIPINRYSYSL